MPYQPWKLGVHRNASIALFRALLNRSKAAQIDDDARHALQNVVRNTFKQYRFEQSRVRLATFFQEGYEAITLLKASSNGDPKATSSIVSRLEAAFPKSKEPPPLNAYQKRLIKAQLKAQLKATAAQAEAQKPKVSFLETRPRLDLDADKPRKIPRFVNAGGIPMLRVKKPQPEALSGYIRKRLNKRQRRKLQVQVLEKEHKRLAQDEDAWEAIIKRQGILESGTAHETTYKAGVQGVLREIGSRIALENKKHLIYARRMQEIVLKERRLALREKRRRRRGKRRVSVRIRKAAGERVGKSKVKGIATRRKEKKAQRGEAKRRRAQLPGLTRPEAGSPLVQKETGTRGGQPLGERGAGSGQQPGNPRTIGSEKSLGRVGKGSNQKQQPTRQRAPVGVKQVWNQMRAGIEKEEGVKHNSSQARKVGRGMKPGDGDKAHGMKRAGSKKPVDVKTREGVIRKMIRGKDISK